VHHQSCLRRPEPHPGIEPGSPVWKTGASPFRLVRRGTSTWSQGLEPRLTGFHPVAFQLSRKTVGTAGFEPAISASQGRRRRPSWATFRGVGGLRRGDPCAPRRRRPFSGVLLCGVVNFRSPARRREEVRTKQKPPGMSPPAASEPGRYVAIQRSPRTHRCRQRATRVPYRSVRNSLPGPFLVAF
jgi:hypothetical protein